ncbi:hypothetical protein PTKIN_Ptkin02bG0113000 [Pterospermum kingtungense]
MSLKSAIELSILDIVHNHDKLMTINELVTALPIFTAKAYGVYRLMSILVHSGFFLRQKSGENEQEEGYVLTNISQLLLKDDPLKAMFDPILTKPCNFLGTWFQNDDPTSFSTAHGKTFQDYGGHEQKLNHFFNEAMASDAWLVTIILIHKCKGVFEGLKSLVDVGGGKGTVAKAIAEVFPHLQYTNFDLLHIVIGLHQFKSSVLKF